MKFYAPRKLLNLTQVALVQDDDGNSVGDARNGDSLRSKQNTIDLPGMKIGWLISDASVTTS